MQESCLLHLSVLCVGCIALSIMILSFLSLSLPHQQACQMQISSESDPIQAKLKDDHHTEFRNNLHKDNYAQPLGSVHTKDCNLNLALHRFSSVGAGYQANCLFSELPNAGEGKLGGGDGQTTLYIPPFGSSEKTISWQRDLFSFQSSPNKQNWQNETWETLATKESSLPRIKVNNSFVGFCFIFQAILLIKRNCGICRKPKH